MEFAACTGRQALLAALYAATVPLGLVTGRRRWLQAAVRHIVRNLPRLALALTVQALRRTAQGVAIALLVAPALELPAPVYSEWAAPRLYPERIIRDDPAFRGEFRTTAALLEGRDGPAAPLLHGPLHSIRAAETAAFEQQRRSCCRTGRRAASGASPGAPGSWEQRCAFELHDYAAAYAGRRSALSGALSGGAAPRVFGSATYRGAFEETAASLLRHVTRPLARAWAAAGELPPAALSRAYGKVRRRR
eukprot:TRINITY_DN18904_c0_g2_i1.p1 TRINITY_DN18904_c0_g2~~TRINITY_DN18904_c0_g2_i1.p1  ORF type:complete len:249 (+),score=55.23 TRINITY_DN18904_c0_g2_i1:1000-1746(+)